MTEIQEHLFLTHEIPGALDPQVLELLTPSIDDLRAYYGKRQQMIDDLLDRIEAGEIKDPGSSPIYIDDVSLEVCAESTPEEAVILRSGEVLVGPQLQLHIGMYEGGDNYPRAQLGRLADAIVARGLVSDYPYITATTYPKLARLAHKMIGMEYAVATYFPANDVSRDNIRSIQNLSTVYLRKKKRALELGPSLRIESLAMPTEAFVERWGS